MARKLRMKSVHILSGADMDDLHAFMLPFEHLHPPTPREERALLVRKAAGDNDAREELIVRNSRLVVALARNKAGQGVSLADLLSAGMVGLMRAVDKFDVKYSNAFSTYASWWVDQSISRELMYQASALQPSIHIQERLKISRHHIEDFTHRFGRAPTPDEMEAMGIDVAKHQRHEAIRRPVSIEALTYNVPSTPDAFTDVAADREYLTRLARGLDERTWYCIRRHHIDGVTLQQIGDEIDMSRERVRQIIAAGFLYMRERAAGISTPELKAA